METKKIVQKKREGNTSLDLIPISRFINKARNADLGDDASIAELKRIMMMYTRHYKILENLDTGREEKISRSAVNFALILTGAAKNFGLQTQSFKTFDKAIDFLREKSGLDEIRIWLQKTATADLRAVESIRGFPEAINFLREKSNLGEIRLWLQNTAVVNQTTIKSVKTLEKALELLKKKSNFEKVQTLLRKTALKSQDSIESIINNDKGNNDGFTGLWNFHFSQIDQIKDYDRLKQVVFDWKAWFAFIVSTETRMSTQDRINWYGETAPFNKWNKDRVFLSLIIAMTLGCKPRPYGMEEVVLFIEKVGQFDLWVKDLEQKFASIVEDDGVAQMMWKHSAMKGAIEFLKKPSNRSVARLIEDRNIRLDHFQRILYDQFRDHLKRAFVVAEEYEASKYGRLQNKTYISWTKENAIREFNEGIYSYDPTSFAKAIKRIPSVISFLDEKNLFRLYVSSVGIDAPLRDEIVRVCDPGIVSRVIENISEPITVERMLQALWRVRDMNGIKIDAYLDADQKRWIMWSDRNAPTEGSVYNQIVNKFRWTIGNAPLDKLLSILIELEKVDIHVGNDLINIGECMALVLSFKRNKIPSYIVKRVTGEKWYKLISKVYDERYYSERIQNSLLKDIEFKKLDGMDIPALKDAIRQYTANAL